MLHFHTENPSNPDSAKPLLAFKPRQLLLAEHNRRIKMTSASSMEEKTGKIASLTPESKQILHQSIVHYLHRNGFSKTLKRFQSEAQIQNDTWKDSSLHLEDVFAKYMNGCNSDAKLTASKKPEPANENDEAVKQDTPKPCATIDGISAKKKKEDIAVTEAETKPKKKKKSKRDSDSPAKPDVTTKPVVGAVNGSEIDEKPKNKKKKGTRQEQEDEKPEPRATKTEPVTDATRKEKKKKKESAVETEDHTQNGAKADKTKKDEKSSKKRKRLPSDENDHRSTQTESAEESKRQKTEAAKETNKESVVANGQANGESEVNAREKSGSQKSARKQLNGSAEPKTVNAFQRVKIDQVEFAHEKLQDNSYWAKDGAEIGYGAKAQDVLGQVRGRDFRHEKTKKKRGSYRGGLIDLQSHSIKFDYSDED